MKNWQALLLLVALFFLAQMIWDLTSKGVI